ADLHHVRPAYSWVTVAVSNGGPTFTETPVPGCQMAIDIDARTSRKSSIFLAEDDRLNVYAGELEMRPPRCAHHRRSSSARPRRHPRIELRRPVDGTRDDRSVAASQIGRAHV